METTFLVGLVRDHRWIAATAVVVGFVIRILKSDTKIPIDVPPRARIWLVFVLGIASGVLEKIAKGGLWEDALLDGLLGAGLAVVGHETIVASLRSGKEISIPGLIKPGASPSPGAPATEPPPAIAEDEEPPATSHQPERDTKPTDPPAH